MSTGSRAETQLDTEHFVVTKWTIDPGGFIPMHRHELEYVAVPLTTSTMHVVNADGSEIVSELTQGVTYSRPAGSEHRVENRGTEPIVFIEVEKRS